jgi:hypothetical protein
LGERLSIALIGGNLGFALRKAQTFTTRELLSADTHSIRALDHAHWGVKMTRKGGLPADRALNAMSLLEIAQYLGRKRRRSLARAA